VTTRSPQHRAPGYPDGTAAPDGTGDPELTIVAGSPTPAELAAITAVVTAMLAEITHGERAEVPRVSAWQRSQRCIRVPLAPGPGAWRSFSGS
jgi:hypothetical protein